MDWIDGPNVFVCVWDVPLDISIRPSRYPRLNSDWPPLRFLDRDRDWTVNNLEVEEARGFRIQDAQGGQVERQA